MKQDIRQLRKDCQRPAHEEGLPTRYIRKVSIYASRMVLATSITPNQITIAGILLFLAGTFLLSLGRTYFSLLGACIMELSMIFCAIDGEVARYKKMQSWLGIYYEFMGHCLRQRALLLGLTLNLFFFYRSEVVAILGLFGFMFISLSYRDGENFVSGARLKTGDFGLESGVSHNHVDGRGHGLLSKKLFHLFTTANISFVTVPVLVVACLCDAIFEAITPVRFIDIYFFFYGIIYPAGRAYLAFSALNKKRLELDYQQFLRELNNDNFVPRWRV